MSLELGIETGLWIAYFVGFISAFGLVFVIQWGTERDNKRMDKIIGARFEKLQSSLNHVNFVTRNREKPIERTYTVKGSTPSDFVPNVPQTPPTLPTPNNDRVLADLRRRVDKCQADSQAARVAIKNLEPASLYIEPSETQKEIRDIWDQLGEIAKDDCDSAAEKRDLKKGLDEVRKRMDSLDELWDVVKKLKLAEHHRKNRRR